MKQQLWRITRTLAAFILMMGVAAADSEFLMHGRVSFDTGTAMVKNTSEDDWSAAVVNTLIMPGDTLWVDQSGTAELEMAGASFLRLADGSKAEVVSLPPNAYIRGWTGSFYVHRLTRSQGDFIFTTPSAIIEIPADAMVRVDIDITGAATVSVRWGSAKVRTDQGGDVLAAESMRVWVDPGLLPSDPTPFDRAQTDAFDEWNNERARILAEGTRTAPKNVVLRDTTVGRYDLARYGEWVYVDNRPYWRPTVVVNYVPYRYGYWNYASGIGHVWVDEYPFAYVTTHYGRWRHTTHYGWIWSYDPVWSPAWVASVRVGDYYAWAPVDYYYRPVVVTGGATFVVGGVSFCRYSTSYAHATYLYAGPRYVYAPTTVVINTFTSTPMRQVNVWNIAHDRRSRPSVPYNTQLIAGERDYNPRRSIRGGQGDWVKDFAPSDRARRLEENLGRTDFASATRRSPGVSTRTAVTDGARMANTRQVRLAQTEQTYRPTRERSADATDRAPFVSESTRLGTIASEARQSVRSASPNAAESLRDHAGAPTARNNAVASVPTRTGAVGESSRSIEPGRDRSRSSVPDTSPRGDVRTTRPERTSLRTLSPMPDKDDAAVRSSRESERVAVRDMESGAPAPRTGIAPERTAPRPTPAPTMRRDTPAPSTSVRRDTPTPSTSVRRDTSTPSTSVRRDTPAPSPAPTMRRDTPTPAPAPTVRRESAPTQRSAPAPTPAPTVRRESAPTQRSAPAPTPAPTVRRESAPTQRSTPAPTVRRESAPTQRSAPVPTPAPAVRRESTPMQRGTPSPTVRRESTPMQRSAPAPMTAPRSSSVAPPTSSGNRGSLSGQQRPQAPTAPSGSGTRGRR